MTVGGDQAQLTPQDRETLKAILRLLADGDQARPRDLGDRLDVSPATVTFRLKRLDDLGLATHVPYQGVTLTEEGRTRAVSEMRRHRIVERFLSDMLGYPWERADKLAVTFEHALPREVVQRLFVALDRPQTCPHGFPIPEADAGELPALPTLADLQPDDEAEVALSGELDPEVVAFLEGMGIRPGIHLVVKERHPFDGPVVVSVDGIQRLVGNAVARQVHAIARKG